VEDRYARDGSLETTFRLRHVLQSINRPGNATLLIPPDDDTHRIANVGSAPAYSVHIYGALLSERRSQSFDLASGRVSTWDDDPIGTFHAWGGKASLRSLMGIREGTDRELIETLKQRVQERNRGQVGGEE
jgi:hypothetical protein